MTMASATAFVLFFLHLLFQLSACNLLGDVDRSQFPKDFLFGTATSSYQIAKPNYSSSSFRGTRFVRNTVLALERGDGNGDRVMIT
ncbi:hypothetical protein ACLOJK_011385 [Asimina triloba]